MQVDASNCDAVLPLCCLLCSQRGKSAIKLRVNIHHPTALKDCNSRAPIERFQKLIKVVVGLVSESDVEVDLNLFRTNTTSSSLSRLCSGFGRLNLANFGAKTDDDNEQDVGQGGRACSNVKRPCTNVQVVIVFGSTIFKLSATGGC